MESVTIVVFASLWPATFVSSKGIPWMGIPNSLTSAYKNARKFLPFIDLNQNWNVLTDFSKLLSIKPHINPFSHSQTVTCIQTDKHMHRLLYMIHSVVKAPKT
jgi:hypothetical protein